MAFADTMVAKYETLLQQCAGVKSVNVDGNTVTFEELEAKYQYWKKLAARASGARPFAARIKLN